MIDHDDKLAFNYNTARKFAKSSTTLPVFTKYRKRPLQHLFSWERPLNVGQMVLDPLSNKRPLSNRGPLWELHQTTRN